MEKEKATAVDNKLSLSHTHSDIGHSSCTCMFYFHSSAVLYRHVSPADRGKRHLKFKWLRASVKMLPHQPSFYWYLPSHFTVDTAAISGVASSKLLSIQKCSQWTLPLIVIYIFIYINILAMIYICLGDAGAMYSSLIFVCVAYCVPFFLFSSLHLCRTHHGHLLPCVMDVGETPFPCLHSALFYLFFFFFFFSFFSRICTQSKNGTNT